MALIRHDIQQLFLAVCGTYVHMGVYAISYSVEYRILRKGKKNIKGPDNPTCEDYLFVKSAEVNRSD